MNYGCCAVRFDLGKEIRIRTVQFFDILGKHSSPEIVSHFHFISVLICTSFYQISIIAWLTKDRKYHHSQVDLEV